MVVVGVLVASEGGDVRSRPRPCHFTVSLEITGVTRRVGRFSYRIPIHAVFSKPPVTQSSIGKMPPCAIGPKHRRVWRYMSVIMKPHCVASSSTKVTCSLYTNFVFIYKKHPCAMILCDGMLAILWYARSGGDISSHAPEVPRNLMVCSIPCRGIHLLGCVEAVPNRICSSELTLLLVGNSL